MRISDWSSDVCSSDLADRLDKIEIGDRRAHRAFGDFADRPFGIGELEEEKLGIAHRPADLIGEVDDDLVARQPEILVGGVRREFGRASCREKVCQYGSSVGGAV